jgi:serine/threonine-protein kinase
MAELHLARTRGAETPGRLVVIKRVLPHLANQAGYVRMFLAEARLAATLHHENIVRIYDTGSANGSYFCAMEALHGADVRQIFRAVHVGRREVPVAHAVNILVGVCAGLHYAHEKLAPDGQPLHLVHRDVSPQNVFVTFDGTVKLLDFGIAKTSHRMTASRRAPLRGKLAYLSPEQCRGETLDRRADVYAAAVMLWELTTGQRLRRRHGESDQRIVRAILDEEAPPPSAVKPGYPPELDAIVARGLRRDRAARYQTARELAADLEGFARAHGLAVGAADLAAYMRELFPTERARWEEAQREEAALADEIARAFRDRLGGHEEVAEADAPGATAPAADATPALELFDEATARQTMLAGVPEPPRPAPPSPPLSRRLGPLTVLLLAGAALACLLAAAAGWLLWNR